MSGRRSVMSWITFLPSFLHWVTSLLMDAWRLPILCYQSQENIRCSAWKWFSIASSEESQPQVDDSSRLPKRPRFVLS
ncbi:hypothetical protein PAXINDRAFT_104031 [Paxillus involutus ATCC 200175]|uniref:Secreted protein n=1 Tax=Paxillus involutus ATCC 200175 TaxID=664439 RepID=A0A0C9T931_PAXIN|nr:hypothetical protein PAXINDRAFT_104031 [Paxillus involutus ATCC 200175]